MLQFQYLFLILVLVFVCCLRDTGEVESVHVGLDNVGHDEGGLVDAVPLPRDGDDDLLGAHLRLLDHDPGAGVVRDAADDLARHPRHVLQHAAGDLDVLGGDVGAALHEDLVVVLLSPGALVGDGVL